MMRSRNRHAAGKNGASGTDIMTTLVGCLILILMAVMLLVFVVEVTTTTLASPEQKGIESALLRPVVGFDDARAFPDGDLTRESIYLDVYGDKVVLVNQRFEIPQRALWDENHEAHQRFHRILESVEQNADEQTVVMLVRPGAAKTQRMVRKVVKGYDVDLGIELFETSRQAIIERPAGQEGR